MLTFLGLHIGNPVDALYKPNILSEIRRRLFWQLYIIDKSIATFVGRPPLLAWKHCTTPLPLDLDDKELLLDLYENEQGAEMSRLHDENSVPTIGASTILRARASIAIVREEILDGALGNTLSIPSGTIK